MFQYPEYQLFEETVAKRYCVWSKNMGLSEEEIDQRVQEAAEFVGLPKSYMEKTHLNYPVDRNAV